MVKQETLVLWTARSENNRICAVLDLNKVLDGDYIYIINPQIKVYSSITTAYILTVKVGFVVY